MNVSDIRKSLLNSEIALFEVNKNKLIKWKNNSFKDLFNFLESVNSNKILNFKKSSKGSFLSLSLNRRKIFYKTELLIKIGNHSLYKINDYQVKKIKVLKDGMNCIKSGKIKFAMQKQYKLEKLTVSGYEFLARMYLKNESLVSNENFMPLIDSNYQLKILLPKVLSQIAFIKNKIGKKISWINVSAELLETKSFYKDFTKIVNNFGLEKKLIGIEITESHKIISNNKIINSLVKLKSDKFSIAMDDFGSGYANIRRLSILPVDIVKLDKSFVFDINNKNTKSLIKGIVNIGNTIGFSVLAEGIETKKDLLSVRNLGVKYGQGWYIGRPEILSN